MMKIPIEEIKYIVDSFETDSQYDTEENAKFYRDKIQKVRLWMENVTKDDANNFPSHFNIKPLLTNAVSNKPTFLRGLIHTDGC